LVGHLHPTNCPGIFSKVPPLGGVEEEEEEAPRKEIRVLQSQIVSDTLGDDLLSTTSVIHL
jgi:hypothetical protein